MIDFQTFFLNAFCFPAAVAPSWLALLPNNIEGTKGGFVWYDKKIVDWIHGPMPPSLRP